MSSRLTPIALLLVLSFAPAFAASGTFYTNEDVEIKLRTNTPGGECTVVVLGVGDVDVFCDDGIGNTAYGNTTTGCIETEDSGQCNSGGVPPAHTHSSTDVTCGQNTYEVTTGNDDGTCTVGFDPQGNASGASCDDGDGNSASVDCSANDGNGSCSATSGSGDCDLQSSP